MRYIAGAIALIAGGTVFLAPASADDPTDREFLAKLERQARRAAEVAEPCIACIVVSRSDHYPKTDVATDTPGKLGEFDRGEFLKASATIERLALANRLDLSNPDQIGNHTYVGGVVIDPAGLVLTTYHAIDGATKVYVHLPRGQGGTMGSYADIYAADTRSDLAVLKLLHPPEGLKAIAIREVRTSGPRATVFPGKLIGLAANPYVSGFALGRPAFYYGGITSVRHRFPPPGANQVVLSESLYRYGQFLEYQLTARGATGLARPRLGGGEVPDDRRTDAITGGALLNLDGEMIGLTTATAVVYDRPIGPGYAIPMDANMKRIVEVLRRGEEIEYGFLGIKVDPQASGIHVTVVLPFSPAHYARLGPGDVITEINDDKAESYPDLLFHAGNALAGTKLKLTVRSPHSDISRTLDLTLGKYRNEQPYIATVRPDPVFGLRVDHLSILVQQSPPQAPAVSRLEIRGVCMREVVPNTPAAALFKTLGDDPTAWIITHVNGAPVATPTEFYSAAKGQKALKLTLRDWAEARREVTLP